jgi:hypothetical protein
MMMVVWTATAWMTAARAMVKTLGVTTPARARSSLGRPMQRAACARLSAALPMATLA